MQAPGARGPRRAGRRALHGHALARVTGRAVSGGGQHPPAPDPGAWPSRTGSGRGGACLPPPPHMSLPRRGFSEVVGVFPKLRPSQTMSPPHHVTVPTPGGARPGMGDREPPAAARLAVGRGCARRHFSGTGFGQLALRPGRARPNRPPMRRTRLPGWRRAGPTAPRPLGQRPPGQGLGHGRPLPRGRWPSQSAQRWRKLGQTSRNKWRVHATPQGLASRSLPDLHVGHVIGRGEV